MTDDAAELVLVLLKELSSWWEGDLIDIAANLGIISKSGAWYAYEGEKIGQGRENAKAFLTAHPEIAEEVEFKIRQHYGLLGGEAVPEAEQE